MRKSKRDWAERGGTVWAGLCYARLGWAVLGWVSWAGRSRAERDRTWRCEAGGSDRSGTGLFGNEIDFIRLDHLIATPLFTAKILVFCLSLFGTILVVFVVF